MFTGIVSHCVPIISLEKQLGLTTMILGFSTVNTHNLHIGASVAINGVCLTVVSLENHHATFHIIQETLNKTNLDYWNTGDFVNVERSATLNTEIGGHLISGHIHETASVTHIEHSPNNRIIHMRISPSWLKYLFPKGFIGLNGTSLTLVDVDPKTNTFTVHLIPETLQKTTWQWIKEGDPINVEIDQQTRTIVDTVERYLGTLSTVTQATDPVDI